MPIKVLNFKNVVEERLGGAMTENIDHFVKGDLKLHENLSYI